MKKDLYESLPQRLKDAYDYYCISDKTEGLGMDKIILEKENEDEVNKFLNELDSAPLFYEYGLSNINKILCYGASGTGKTFLAKCLAAHCEYELLTIDIANIIGSDNAYKELATVFELANHIGTAVIFLDECDAIARQRGSLNNAPQIRMLINGLFKLIDNVDKRCICMAATNLEEQLDLAFIRRFDLKLKFNRPDVNFIDDAILRFINPKFDYVEDANEKTRTALMWALRSYTNLSFAEIEIWVQRAEKVALMEERFTITQSEVYEYMLHNLRFGIYDGEFGEYVFQSGG